MKVDRRLDRLEHQFGLSHKQPRLVIVVTGWRTPAIDEDTCIKILDEAGFLPASGIGKVDLLDIPRGMNAEEAKRYVRENGASICGSRTP